MNEQQWLINGNLLKEEDIPEKAIGFIYIITNLITDRKYIGRKLLTKAAIKTVNGKKKKCRKESDWKNYYGSCKELHEDIEKIGKDNFKRELLVFCNTVATLNYICIIIFIRF